MVLLFFLCQAVAIFIIAAILKKVLDRNLLDVTIKEVEAGAFILDGPIHIPSSQQPKILPAVIVITHKKIADVDRERILKAITKTTPGGAVPDFQIDKKILGGIIIKAGNQTLNYSIADRLRQAFNG